LGSARFGKDLVVVCSAALLCGLVAVLLALAPHAGAADPEQLEAKLASARDEAGSIAAELRQSNERLAAAEAEAAAAEARQQRLSTLLAEGEERTAELSEKLERTREHLARERARLRRALGALADRLVAIYESGLPSTDSLVFGSGDYDDLVTRADYLREIAESDRALADRVAEVRNQVHREMDAVTELHERAVAYDERLVAARENIAAVREEARASAAELHSASASREASLSELKAEIGDWVEELQEARIAASEAEAEEEVGRWLGGPYSIPTYIVMCESGGNYSALNPSSGAGGAYQILPSTWQLYGGKGLPNEASKEEQDRIAAEIWADSGPSAWVCG
jgi:septal ring factor EnvC (AmiA/AmiB activator)